MRKRLLPQLNKKTGKEHGMTLITSLVFLTFASIISINNLQGNRLNQVIQNKISEYETSVIIAKSGLSLGKKSAEIKLNQNLCGLVENKEICNAIGNPEVIVRFKTIQLIPSENSPTTVEFENRIYEIVSTGKAGNALTTIMRYFVNQKRK